MKPEIFKWTLIQLGILLISYFSYAQQSEFNAKDLSLKFPNASAVQVLDLEEVTFQLKNNKLSIHSTNEIGRFHLGDKTIVFNSESVPHAEGFLELEEMEASTIIEENNRKKTIKVKTFEDKEYIRNDIFYDGVKYRKFLYPGLQKGAMTNLKYTYNIPNPNFLIPHFFQSSIPTVKSIYKITFPSQVVVKYKLFGDTTNLKFSKVQNKTETTYTWQMDNLPEKKTFSDGPGGRYFEPHIFVYIEKYKLGNEWKEVLNSEKELYKLFQSFTKDLNKTAASAELKSVVDSIKLKSNSEMATIRNIYYWVQDNIKYIAFEDGFGGQIPRQANDVFLKRYGDCKDLSSLITFMLKQANVPAHLCWIGTNDLPYKFSELPLPNSCNHMIAAVKFEGKWIFLDGTSMHTPFGKPSQFIQGKEAMIGVSDDSFEIVKVPTVPSKENKVIDTTYLTIESNMIKGNVKLELHGYNKSYLLDRLYFKDKNDKIEYLEEFVKKGNSKSKISELTYEHLTNKDMPLVMKFNFSLDDFVRSIESEMYVGLIMEQVFESLKIDTTERKLDRFEKHTYNEESVSILKLPKGYSVKKLPQNISISYPNFSFSCTYQLKNDEVYFRKKFTVNDLKISVKDFQAWNLTIDKLLTAKKEYLVLKQK